MAIRSSTTQIPAREQVRTIEPPSLFAHFDFRELWDYRELFGFLVWRDIMVRYKQTALGAAWAIMVPFTQMVIFAFIFGRLAGLSSDGLPKPVFYYAGLLPWTFLANSVRMSSVSLVGNSRLLTKIYLPRLIVPAAPCLASLVDFAIAFSILVVMMFYYQIAPSLAVFLLLPLMALALCTALGVGLFLSSLNVKYRDVGIIVPFLIQIWMYCTVIVPFSTFSEEFLKAVPERFAWLRYLYGLNPMAGVIEGFRWSLLNTRMSPDTEAPWILLAVGVPSAILLFVIGLIQFKRVESEFADVV